MDSSIVCFSTPLRGCNFFHLWISSHYVSPVFLYLSYHHLLQLAGNCIYLFCFVLAHSASKADLTFFFFFQRGSDDIAQAGFELSALLIQSPECQDYRHTPPYWARSSNSYIKADWSDLYSAMKTPHIFQERKWHIISLNYPNANTQWYLSGIKRRSSALDLGWVFLRRKKRDEHDLNKLTRADKVCCKSLGWFSIK